MATGSAVAAQQGRAPEWAERYPSLPYVLPFLVFLLLLSLAPHLEFLGQWEYPLRVLALAATIYVCSRHVLDFRVRHFVPSVLIGVAVFVLWIAPDYLFVGYREHWLFQNSITGQIKSSIAADIRSNPLVLTFRLIRATLIVPIVEELFWRAWLMRWIINPDFRRVPLGTFAASSMVVTALLFASEHGPYWEVGLITGFIYNFWMVKTKSLGDLILTHGITNGVLSAYVIATGNWQYWL